MALIEHDTFHTPVIEDGGRRCEYEKSSGDICGLLDYEHAVTPETLPETLTALSRHPSPRVALLAQDLANAFGLNDDKDWLVTMNATIILRAENMPEDGAKVYFDDMAVRQLLAQRLRNAVEDTDFYIDFDVTDLEVEEA